MHRNRYLYTLLIILTVILGLASRRFHNLLPHWVQLYLGDTLWALMVFFLIGLIFNKTSTKKIAVMALLFSFGIEISQLYHAEWIDTIRANRIGGLVLGYVFLWSDLVCYTVGIAFGYVQEQFILKKNS